MLGFYENFPLNIHRTETFSSFLPCKKLQQRLVKDLFEINTKKFSFEEIGHPTVHQCTIIFEVGIADAESFNYVDKGELEKALNVLKRKNFQIIDLFCAIRYYKNSEEKKTPLKFDYYLVRTRFNENAIELRVFHERGPRYISPEELTNFLVNEVNGSSGRKILKSVEPA
jgi:hypothetical protein